MGLRVYTYAVISVCLMQQSYSIKQADLANCKREESFGYGYKVIHNISETSTRNNSDLLMKFYVQANSNAHILLSPIPSPGYRTAVYEIVIGAGQNSFSDLRRMQKNLSKFTAKTGNILSHDEATGFWIRQSSRTGLIEVGKEGDDLPFLYWKDISPLNIQYFSFCTWTNVLGIWYYDCRASSSTGKVKVVRALVNYTAQLPDELTFQEGDLLYVFDQVTDPNWWRARCGNRTGLIPSNYVQSQTEEVEMPLHEAARRGNLSFLQECLQQGVSGTGLDSAGNTPLYWASHGGHVDCVNELLALNNPAVNAQNKVGDTSLHVAAARGHKEVVELLLNRGANPQITNKDKQTPLDLAQNSAIKNVLQLASSNHHNSSLTTDYADDSD